LWYGRPAVQGQNLIDTVLDGRYRLVKQLTRGGMGEIYAAEHIDTRRRFAVKILGEPWSRDQVTRERFRLEARATSRIVHPHIVEMIDYGVTDDGVCYLVMELLYGEDLQATIRREGRLPLRRAAKILVQICKALAAAHQHNIVHRDLKPGNCFRIGFQGVEDFIKLVDFGIAKKLPDEDDTGDDPLTTAGTVLGTVYYMPPEQATGGTIDHRVDVYAAGAMFYQLVTGHLPFKGRNAQDTFRLLLVEDPKPAREVAPDLDLPAAFDTLVRKALAKRPESRFQSMDELAAAIATLGGQEDRRASASMIAGRVGRMTPPERPGRESWFAALRRWFRRR
jgi:eukaryotic-like serine/threonine-protein kinase